MATPFTTNTWEWITGSLWTCTSTFTRCATSSHGRLGSGDCFALLAAACNQLNARLTLVWQPMASAGTECPDRHRFRDLSETRRPPDRRPDSALELDWRNGTVVGLDLAGDCLRNSEPG